MGSNKATAISVMPISEIIDGAFHDTSVITELRGSYPLDITHFDGIDVEELTKGDEDAMFLTIPIARVGVTSGNKRYYDEEWVQELQKQTVSERPIGIMGHIKPEDRGSSFPEEAVHWLGVLREGDTLWGKGYIPPGIARDRIRRYKATGRKIATSIFANAKGVWDTVLGAYRMQASTLKLNQIDIAPYDRAGVRALGMVPILTAEMEETEQEPEMNKDEAIQEIVKTVVPPLRGWPGKTVTPPSPDTQQISELTAIRQALGVDDKADLPKVISEMRQAAQAPQTTYAPEAALVAEMCAALGGVEPAKLVETIQNIRQNAQTAREQAIAAHITELIDNEETGIKIVEMRPIVRRFLKGRTFNSIEEVDAAFTEVVDDPEMANLFGRQIQEMMGPPQTSPVSPQTKTGNKHYVIPELPKPRQPSTTAPSSITNAT